MNPPRLALALALRHVHFEDCGTLTSLLREVFSWERFVLAFQCHPELRHEDIESWLIGHANEIAAASGASVEQLRKDTQYYGPTLTACAKPAFTEWLESVELPTS
jgi:GMP synthase (glutamine-hydrolysing)